MTGPADDRSAEIKGDAQRRTSIIGGVIGLVAPVVIRQIDMDAIVKQLDVNAIAEQLDLDALMSRLDMDALVEQLDINAVAEKLDLDALMSRLDMDALVEQLDVNAIAGQLDLNELMGRLDMEALVEQLDINAIAEKLDLNELMARVDMAQLTAGATQDVATSGLDLVRRQLVRADRTVDGLFDRLLRRKPGDRPEAPVRLTEPTAALTTATGVIEPQRREVSGHFAGPVTRILSLVGDIFGGLTSFGFFGAITLYFLSVFTGVDETLTSGGWVHFVIVSFWLLLWFSVPVALFGRTIAMAAVGLAVVRRDGAVANGRRALVRAIVLPFSLVILLLGLLGMVIGKERRTLHDVAAGTVVVYDWGEREAEQPVTIREQLSARVIRRRAADPPDTSV